MADISNQATDTARRIVALREEHRELIARKFGGRAGNAILVLESLYKRPFISVDEAARMTGVSYVAANTLIAKMERAGIRREYTGQARNRPFRYDGYVDLFD